MYVHVFILNYKTTPLVFPPTANSKQLLLMKLLVRHIDSCAKLVRGRQKANNVNWLQGDRKLTMLTGYRETES